MFLLTKLKRCTKLLMDLSRSIYESRADSLPNTSLRSVSNHNFTIPQPKCSLYKESLSYSGPVIWNAIPTDIKKSSTINAFVNKLRDWMLHSNSA